MFLISHYFILCYFILEFVTINTEVTAFFTALVKSTVQYRESNKINRPDFLQLLINMKNDEKTLTIDQLVSMLK